MEVRVVDLMEPPYAATALFAGSKPDGESLPSPNRSLPFRSQDRTLIYFYKDWPACLTRRWFACILDV